MTARIEQLSAVKREAFRRLREPKATEWARVSLRSGDGPVGLVLVHPVGGGLACYMPLLRELPAGVPVVGFAADRLSDGEHISGRITQLARRYLAALELPGAPSRRWCFAGWSFGGAVAFEMARLAGPDSPVILLDTDRPVEPDGTDELSESTIQWFFVGDLARACGVPQEKIAVERAATTGPVSLSTLLQRLGMAVEMGEVELAQRFEVYAVNSRALARYQPGQHNGPTTLVRAGRPPGMPISWQEHTSRLVVHEVPAADHYTLLTPAHLDVPRRAIVEALDSLSR